jgi:hypothetical protein
MAIVEERLTKYMQLALGTGAGIEHGLLVRLAGGLPDGPLSISLLLLLLLLDILFTMAPEPSLGLA